MKLIEMNREQLSEFKKKVQSDYDEFKSRGLSLDMSRGKPCAEQLDLSMPLLNALVSDSDIKDGAGTDCRNYGILDGIKEAKELFAEILGVKPEEVIVGGNSSLSLMYDTLMRLMVFGTLGNTPWCKEEKIKFLCPAPGYDRHFAITEKLGMELVTVPMTKDGPDMDIVEKLVADKTVKGIWCVPMYSNPEGTTYSDETVKRLASMKTAAPDFRIFWDNAYCIHHLSDTPDVLLNIMDECRKNGTEDRVYMFTSTSKVSFSGAGVSAMAASEKNIADIKKTLTVQTIGYDKMNQLRHIRFFKDFDGVKAHMKKHAEILAPRFKAVLDALEKEIAPLGIGEWNSPNGGYFISFNTMDGCAKRVVELCKEAGVVLTGAGATFPYGKDPADRNIRIAPTYPSVDELEKAVELFCICVKLASAEKLLG
ncbi:MAG: aminotransferase class I/II-fold pyridoxal phosphate-dependent enzyme [Ruminococcus sp.]|nr:aminotransferase class I/II-fold pyridoxal phosphate-dependent enzyme [Ruminococcus sp.]